MMRSRKGVQPRPIHSTTNLSIRVSISNKCGRGIGNLTYGVEGAKNRNDPSRPNGQHRDFDDGANDLWTLYEKEVKRDDEALIKPLKKDMDAVLIFVCACFSGLFNQG